MLGRHSQITTLFQVIALSIATSTIPAQATSFGEVAVVGQIKEAPFVFRGRIGRKWTEKEPESGKPYTYWNLAISDVMRGDYREPEVVVRQPGGEIDTIGYTVAGSANFSDGEEVVVMAGNTKESPTVKEVIGLTSGKYTVNEKGGLKNGLGLELKNAAGHFMSVDDLAALVDRVEKNRVTPDDERIKLNPAGVFAQRHEFEGHPEHATEDLLPAAVSASTTDARVANPAPQTGKSLDASPQSSERKIAAIAVGGSGEVWSSIIIYTIIGIVAGVLLVGLGMLLRR